LTLFQRLTFPSFEHAFNIDWSSKRHSRRSKEAVPLTFFQIKGMRFCFTLSYSYSTKTDLALLHLQNADQVITPENILEQFQVELKLAKFDEALPMTVDDAKLFVF
jgi:hypothetical protein